MLRRGQAENHIKSWKTHLAADRTSCTRATANQLRLFLHAGAYWIMWGLRVSMPKKSMWRIAQFDTLRLGPAPDTRRGDLPISENLAIHKLDGGFSGSYS